MVRKRILWVEGGRFKSPIYRKNPPPCIITLRSCVLSQPSCFKDKANTGKSFKLYLSKIYDRKSRGIKLLEIKSNLI